MTGGTTGADVTGSMTGQAGIVAMAGHGTTADEGRGVPDRTVVARNRVGKVGQGALTRIVGVGPVARTVGTGRSAPSGTGVVRVRTGKPTGRWSRLRPVHRIRRCRRTSPRGNSTGK